MVHFRHIIIFYWLCVFSALSADRNSSVPIVKPWTTCYAKHFSSQSKPELHVQEPGFKKKNISHFNQLVFSWNALPKKGFFRYFVRVYYAGVGKNKRWSPWHKMAESGVAGHRTFYNRDKDGLEYKHVRLELSKGKLADGFEIKVEAVDEADLADVHMICASCSNTSHFTKEKVVDRYDHLTSVMIEGVPMRSQMFLQHPQAEGLCSPTALGMLTEFVGGKKIDPILFADGVYDQGLKVHGSWPCNTAHAFQALDGRINFHVERLHAFSDLYKLLVKGTPVVVSICGVLDGAPKTNFDGHLLLVVGYDAATRSVICCDSAVGYGLRISAGAYLDKVPVPKNIIKQYPLENFLRVWEARHRLAYIATP